MQRGGFNGGGISVVPAISVAPISNAASISISATIPIISAAEVLIFVAINVAIYPTQRILLA
jgi:hypothetical protein